MKVTPFVLIDDEIRPSFDALVNGPLEVVIEKDCIKFFSLVVTETDPVWVLRFVSFVAMDCGAACKVVVLCSVFGLFRFFKNKKVFRIMLSATSGVLVFTPLAEELMLKVDQAINAMLREEVVSDMGAFMERIRRTAHVLLQSHPRDAVKQKVAEVILKEMGLETEEIVSAVSNVVDEVAKELGKP
jgi:hypothetical protein